MNYFDCHVDTLTEIVKPGETLGKNTGNLDLDRVAEFAEKYTQIFAVWKDEQLLNMAHPEEEFYGYYKRAVELLEKESSRLLWCKNADDMERAHAEGKAAAFLSVEDISIMGSYVEQIRELGICFAMLTWNYDNCYGCGAAFDQEKGLKEQGKSVVKMLLDQGIVLDISHLSDKGAEDIFELTDAPVIASHSNVRALWNCPRNLTDELARELIRRKGLIGMNFFENFIGEKPGIADLIRHMDAILEMGGEDVLAIGSDYDGCHSRFPQGIRGVESIPYLRECMEKEGFDNRILDKIFFENAQKFVLKNVK